MTRPQGSKCVHESGVLTWLDRSAGVSAPRRAGSAAELLDAGDLFRRRPVLLIQLGIDARHARPQLGRVAVDVVPRAASQRVTGMLDTPTQLLRPAFTFRVVCANLLRHDTGALKRGSRFITAAQEILAETNRPDFTLQEAVDRAHSSMRTFYQHFASKDDLLLAVFEEEMDEFVSVVNGAIADAGSTDALDRIKIMVDTLLTEIKSDSKHGRLSRALTLYYMNLIETHPNGLAHAIQPQYDVTLRLIEDGVRAGLVRDDIPAETLAELVMRLSISVAHSHIRGNPTGGEPVEAADAWQFVLGGIARDDD